MRPVALSMMGWFSFFVGGSTGPASSAPSGKLVVATAIARQLLLPASAPSTVETTRPRLQKAGLFWTLSLSCTRPGVLADSDARGLHECNPRLVACVAAEIRLLSGLSRDLAPI